MDSVYGITVRTFLGVNVLFLSILHIPLCDNYNYIEIHVIHNNNKTRNYNIYIYIYILHNYSDKYHDYTRRSGSDNAYP